MKRTRKGPVKVPLEKIEEEVKEKAPRRMVKVKP
jgi:hypothetical protein